MLNRTVDVDFRKWGGAQHWRYPMVRLGRDEFGTWLGGPAGTPYTGPRGAGTWLHGCVTLVPHDEWWVAAFNDGHPDIALYVDIATPARWLSDSHVTSVDLDLDVARLHDGSVVLLDEDEFAEHRVTLGYPADVIRYATASARDLTRLVTDECEPFRLASVPWLDRLRAATRRRSGRTTRPADGRR